MSRSQERGCPAQLLEKGKHILQFSGISGLLCWETHPLHGQCTTSGGSGSKVRYLKKMAYVVQRTSSDVCVSILQTVNLRNAF